MSEDFFTAHYQLFTDHLSKYKSGTEPAGLYEPMQYILGLGGKRIRPVMALMGCELMGKSPQKALPQALAVELFHNFSLIHDDIMDKAPLRRGKATVHEKWDTVLGILSGDGMLIKAYEELAKADAPLLPSLLETFNKMGVEVCEGQVMDMDFEKRNDVTHHEYITMIGKKTSALLGASARLGAIVGGGQGLDLDLIYEFGYNLGVSFQIKDDYLDAFGDPESFGKQVGGDILANKKTLLYILAMEMGNDAHKSELKKWFSTQEGQTNKIEAVKKLFVETGAAEAVLAESERFYKKSLVLLDQVEVPEANKQNMKMLASFIKNRAH